MSVISNVLLSPKIFQKENTNLNNQQQKPCMNLIKNDLIVTHFSSCKMKTTALSDYEIQMEHSYSRDCRPIEGSNGLKTRTLMVHRPPQCPSCHTHPQDENCDLDESNHPAFPSYNEVIAKESMTECTRIANSVRNSNSDDVNWENCLNKIGWTLPQSNFFTKVAKILDLDHLARLATIGKQHEPIQKRVIVDKSAQRMRKVLANIAWDTRLTQWLHSILLECLPPLYMASYLDILQTLKSKLPILMDKMLFSKPMHVNQDLLVPVMKKQWDPVLVAKNRKLPGNTVIVVIPSTPTTGSVPSRMQKWYQLFASMAQIMQINVLGNSTNVSPIEQVAEHIVQLARIKIQELRNEQPSRNIILVGFNAGAALALQVAMSGNVNSVVCMGFAYNTLNGTRGAPDDHILEITIPIMFVIGQNSARSSQEEIESLREKMHSETSLVVVGSADDVLRVPKNKRQIESVTQSMVDSMVTDEIYEFAKNCILNPPGPRVPTVNAQLQQSNLSHARKITAQTLNRKRKSQDPNGEADTTPSKKSNIGRPRTRPLITTNKQNTNQSNETLNAAIKSILPSGKTLTNKLSTENLVGDGNELLGSYEIVTSSNSPQLSQTKLHSISTVPQVTTITNSSPVVRLNPNQSKIKMLPSQQFIQIKPPLQSQSKIYTIKTSSMMNSSGSVKTTNSGEQITRTNQGQLYTVKTTPSGGTQYVPTTSNQLILSPQKFTVLKSGNTNIIGDHKLVDELSTTNIFDMPIIFADNEGNIHDSNANSSTSSASEGNYQTSNATSSPSNQIILKTKDATSTNQSPTSGTLLLNTNALNKPKTGKVVFINRNTMKPCPNIISKSAVPPMKYTKVVVTNPKTLQPSLVTRATAGTTEKNIGNSGNLIISSGGDAAIKQQSTTLKNWSYSIQKNPQGQPSIIKTTPTSGILNVNLTPTTTQKQQYQPIILNIDSDKAKNLIKVDSSQLTKTYVLKQGVVKPMPVFKTSQLNKNLTVKKVMNFIQTKPSTNVASSPVAAGQNRSSGVISNLQSSNLVVKPVQTTTVKDVNKK